jgi:hypothetical protein
MVPSLSGSNSAGKMLDFEDEGSVILGNVRNYLPNSTISHPRRHEASAALL